MAVVEDTGEHVSQFGSHRSFAKDCTGRNSESPIRSYPISSHHTLSHVHKTCMCASIKIR